MYSLQLPPQSEELLITGEGVFSFEDMELLKREALLDYKTAAELERCYLSQLTGPSPLSSQSPPLAQSEEVLSFEEIQLLKKNAFERLQWCQQHAQSVEAGEGKGVSVITPHAASYAEAARSKSSDTHQKNESSHCVSYYCVYLGKCKI